MKDETITVHGIKIYFQISKDPYNTTNTKYLDLSSDGEPVDSPGRMEAFEKIKAVLRAAQTEDDRHVDSMPSLAELMKNGIS